jgi:two-component system sensor histidine kinase YesM
VYQEQFLLFMVIIFLMSTALAIVIANILVRPIRQLKEKMVAAGAGDFVERVDYDAHNEIGDIIKSYNRMIGQLDQTIRENLSIMEENAKNKIRENELLSMKTRAELHMLQAQINPHFLYNTLEAINMRSMQSGNQEISTIVGALADLFRYSVSKGADTVLLMNELNHAANYITIQQIRFGHSFEAEFDVPEELKDKRVLRFILQPILENAIKHGFAGWQYGGRIRIAASATEEEMRLTIGDNGVGMPKQALEHLRAEMEKGLGDWSGDGGGIGLKNVYYRLKLFYKDRVSMAVGSELMKGTEITIAFPLYESGESSEPA